MLDIICDQKISIIKQVIFDAVAEACASNDVIIITCKINDHALERLYDGAIGKAKEVKQYSEKNGSYAGYVLDPITQTPLKTSEGRHITSDLDILMYIGRNDSDRRLLPPELDFGDMLYYEFNSANIINKKFGKAVAKIKKDEKRQYGPIITHGPFNRHGKLSSTCLSFPLTIYFPSGEMKLIGGSDSRDNDIQALLAELNRISTFGYTVEIPADWNLI